MDRSPARASRQPAPVAGGAFSIVPRHVSQFWTLGGLRTARNRTGTRQRKLASSGLLTQCDVLCVRKGGSRVEGWSGRVTLPPGPVLTNRDRFTDVGPSPRKG